MGFGEIKISFKFESSSRLLDSKQYNYLRCAHFATRFPPLLLNISSPVFLLSQNLRIFSTDEHNQKATVYYSVNQDFSWRAGYIYF